MNNKPLLGSYEIGVKDGRICLTDTCWQESAFCWALCRHEGMLVLRLSAAQQEDADILEKGAAVLDDAGCLVLPKAFCDELGGEETVVLTGMGSFAQIMKASAQEREAAEAEAEIDALLELLSEG